MAERRMMAKSVIETDNFMDMPMTTQCLYFHMLIRADDDGFVSNPKRIMREVGCNEDDMKLLVAKGYVILFDSGVIVIRHWKIHNLIRKDRYKPSLCEERNMVSLENNKVYHIIGFTTPRVGMSVGIPTDNQPAPRLSDNRDPQDRLGKDRSEKDSSAPDHHNNNQMSSILSFYEENFFDVTDYIAETLNGLVKDYTYEWVMEAMKVCVKGGPQKSNIRYLEGVLRGWKSDGYAKPWEQTSKSEKDARVSYHEEGRWY